MKKLNVCLWVDAYDTKESGEEWVALFRQSLIDENFDPSITLYQGENELDDMLSSGHDLLIVDYGGMGVYGQDFDGIASVERQFFNYMQEHPSCYLLIISAMNSEGYEELVANELGLDIQDVSNMDVQGKSSKMFARSNAKLFAWLGKG